MTIAEQVRGLAEGHAAALPAEVKSAFALNAYQAELLGELDRRGVTLVARQPADARRELSMQGKNDLGFAVLTDPGNGPARSVGIAALDAITR